MMCGRIRSVFSYGVIALALVGIAMVYANAHRLLEVNRETVAAAEPDFVTPPADARLKAKVAEYVKSKQADIPPLVEMPPMHTDEGGDRKAQVIHLQNASALEVAKAVNEFLQKELLAKSSGVSGVASQAPPVVTTDLINNHLLISASATDLATIKQLVEALDVAPRQYLVRVTICDGEPKPSVRAAREAGKLHVLSRPVITTLANQPATVSVGDDVEIPAGLDQKRKVHVGRSLTVTVSRASDNRALLKMTNELSWVSDETKESATLNIQRTENTGIYPLSTPILTRGGKTRTGEDLWIETMVIEITSREQFEQVTRQLFGKEEE